MREDQEREFWARVDTSAGPDACWPWKFARDRDGYGVWSVYEPMLGRSGPRQWRANRLALATKLGREPVGMACHTCDNRVCCNPSHLYEGDALTNQRDVIARGRQRDRRLVTDPEEIAAIRAEAARGDTYTTIGARHGVSDCVVSRLCRVAGAPPRITSNRARLTARDHVLLADGRADGLGPHALARVFGISGTHAGRVSMLALRRREPHREVRLGN